jgi:DNA-binding PadR family transcriptional regulator
MALSLQPEAWAILALIVEQPGHGYELSQRYEDRLGSFLPLSQPRVYEAIERLRSSMLIEPTESQRSDRRVRRVYGATPKGVRARGNGSPGRWPTILS